MKRLSIITLLIFVCSFAGYSQFWIEFGWNDGRCHDCAWMTQSLRLSGRQAEDYHNIVHKYGKRIEKEARREYKHWDTSYRKIYDLRMDRDRKIQRILSPQQFGLYIRYTRERPQYVHDYRGWYENPKYRGYRISPNWRLYEANYWSFRWGNNDYRYYDPYHNFNHRHPEQRGYNHNDRHDDHRSPANRDYYDRNFGRNQNDNDQGNNRYDKNDDNGNKKDKNFNKNNNKSDKNNNKPSGNNSSNKKQYDNGHSSGSRSAVGSNRR